MRRGFGLGLLALAAVVLLSTGRASAVLSVHPAYVELNLDRGRPSEILTVTNLTDEEVRYRAKVRHFLYTKEGGIQHLPPDEHSLASWTKLNPKEFTIPPKGSRVIRLSVIAPRNLAPGEYWADIEFEPLEGRVTEADDGEGRTIRLEVTASILVPIVGQVGTLTYQVQLQDLSAWKTETGIRVSAHLANTGTGRIGIKGTYEVLNASDEVVAEGLIGDDTILAGGERVFVRLAEGEFLDDEYMVRVRYTSRRIEETIAGQTSVALVSPEEEPGFQP